MSGTAATEEGEVPYQAAPPAPAPGLLSFGDPYSSGVISFAREGVYRLSLQLGIVADPETIIWYAATALAVFVCVVCMLVYMASARRVRERARANALMVEMAEHAPEDDHDEHECEQLGDARAAAPGDSDFEEDPIAGKPRKNGRK